MQLDDLLWILLGVVSQVFPMLIVGILKHLTRKNTSASRYSHS
jgi:hypothetical protein